MPDAGLGAGDAAMGKTRMLLRRSSPSGGEVRGVSSHIPRQKGAVIELGGSGKLPKGVSWSGIAIVEKGKGLRGLLGNRRSRSVASTGSGLPGGWD